MRPTPRLAIVFGLAALPAALAARKPGLGWLVGAFDIALIVLAVIDARLAQRQGSRLLVRRVSPTWVQRGRRFEVTLEAHNPTDRAEVIDVVDRLPVSFEPRERHVRFYVPAKGVASSSYEVVAHRRGEHSPIAPVALHSSRLGLVKLTVPGESGAVVSVLPNLSMAGRFDALVRAHRLHEFGIHRTRQRGDGTEISGLRSYVAGDAYATIDWKATARRGTLIAREIQTEHKQNVVLLVDCGRRMARVVDGHSRLDHAIEAAFFLGHVALANADRVGLLAFSDVVTRSVALGQGSAHARTLGRSLFSMEPVLREPPYRRIATEVLRRFPRRGLIVLFTDVIEPLSLGTLLGPIRLLFAHHTVLCVVFKDDFLEAAANEPIIDDESLFRAGAAADLTIERRRGLRRLRQTGALLVDAPSHALSISVVNRYLELKSRRVL
jgi:uncharacterized protein (DUF58 family)